MSFSFLTNMKNQTKYLNQTTDTVVEAISSADSLVHFHLTVRVCVCIYIYIYICIYIYIYIVVLYKKKAEFHSTIDYEYPEDE